MKQREDRHYEMISSREVLLCVHLNLLSSSGRSLLNVSFYLITKLTIRGFVFR